MGKKKQEHAVEQQENKGKLSQEKYEELDLVELKEKDSVDIIFPRVTYFKEKREARKVYSISISEHKELVKANVSFQVV